MEILGRLIMMVILMALASGIGAVCSLIVYVLIRKQAWRVPTAIAGLFPPAAMAYLLICLIVSSPLSSLVGTPDLLFGDINERLPNGFYLRALDKMPTAGRVVKEGDTNGGVAWVGKLQTKGPLVLGEYDYTYFPKAHSEANRNYFLFDTRDDKLKEFKTAAELAVAGKTELQLIDTPFFHSPPSALHTILTSLMIFIALAPPLAIAAWLLWMLRGFVNPERTS